MKKLLVICGPTATGKTKLALFIAKKFSGELVSADSRQVYKDMDIGTGKDLPVDSKFINSDIKLKGKSIGYYTEGTVRIWGYDLVKPQEGFSVAQYIDVTRKIIKDIWGRSKLPILVGGTGLYIKGLIDGISTAGVAQDISLRKTLRKKSAKELFEILASLDPIRSATLNLSDRNNPRRLIRAIEIAKGKTKDLKENYKGLSESRANILFVGLKLIPNKLKEKVDERVEKRVKNGFENELMRLLRKDIKWDMQAMSSLGYAQWKSYLKGAKEKSVVIDEWKKKERRYAKRQVIWFKRDRRINWFDIGKKNYMRDIEKLVRKWYDDQD